MSEIAVDNGLLRQVDHNVRVAIAQINAVSGQVAAVHGDLARAQERIKQLRAYVEDMRREQRNAAALQRALTEIIRVRQELEQKFGKYQEVRDSMIGILQANDHGLVTTNTISRVSEELMIATPKYWLSPCVIALSAWISNNEELAKKAIEEALSRDAEKTSLLMALICRRAAAVSDDRTSDPEALRDSRFKACQSWLELYFKCQDPNNISRSVLLFVNAYVNGVFGEDENTVVDDFIQNKWLASLAAKNPAFKDEQLATWKGLFLGTMQASGTPAEKKYPTLAKYADKKDFEDIAAYADRVDISENFIEDYFIEINRQKVNTEHLVEIIDEYLSSLVTDFDEVERGLREEEEQYQTIKECQGDIDIANAVIAKKKEKQAHLNEPISLIQYLHNAVAGNNEDDGMEHDISEKKTALRFTKPYIQESYNTFMDEKKDAFPAEIKATVEGVTHKVKSEEEVPSFIQGIRARLEAERDAVKKKVKPVGAIVWAAIIGFFSFIIMLMIGGTDSDAIGGGVVFFVFGLIIAAGIIALGFLRVKKKRNAIDAQYEKRINAAAALVKDVVKEWCAVSADMERFNQKPRFDVGNVQ